MGNFLERLAETHIAGYHHEMFLWSTGAYIQVHCPLELALLLGLTGAICYAAFTCTFSSKRLKLFF